jgi:hypothetical protein
VDEFTFVCPPFCFQRANGIEARSAGACAELIPEERRTCSLSSSSAAQSLKWVQALVPALVQPLLSGMPSL